MELTTLEITTVASDSVLPRVVMVLSARGARIRELGFGTASNGVPGATRIHCLIESAPGRSRRLAGAVARLVDVTHVEIV